MSALAVNDGFVEFAPQRRAATNPAAAAAALLADLLRARGVSVASAVQIGPAPAELPEVAGIDSLPMAGIVAQMLRESDNYTAELLVKELGHRAGSGTTVDGLSALRSALVGQGVDVSGVNAKDGSGLDRGDRATCRAITAALALGGPVGALAQSFPVAGQSGTLSRRFLGTPLVGRLRAKTGSLDRVTSLSGSVDRPGGSLRFALIANGLPDAADRGLRLQEDVALALGTYPEAPDPGALTPLVRSPDS